MESLPAWHTGRALLSQEVNGMVVTVEQMKRLEKKTVELGSSYLQLMEQAGSAAATSCAVGTRPPRPVYDGRYG